MIEGAFPVGSLARLGVDELEFGTSWSGRLWLVNYFEQLVYLAAKRGITRRFPLRSACTEPVARTAGRGGTPPFP